MLPTIAFALLAASSAVIAAPTRHGDHHEEIKEFSYPVAEKYYYKNDYTADYKERMDHHHDDAHVKKRRVITGPHENQVCEFYDKEYKRYGTDHRAKDGLKGYFAKERDDYYNQFKPSADESGRYHDSRYVKKVSHGAYNLPLEDSFEKYPYETDGGYHGLQKGGRKEFHKRYVNRPEHHYHESAYERFDKNGHYVKVHEEHMPKHYGKGRVEEYTNLKKDAYPEEDYYKYAIPAPYMKAEKSSVSHEVPHHGAEQAPHAYGPMQGSQDYGLKDCKDEKVDYPVEKHEDIHGTVLHEVVNVHENGHSGQKTLIEEGDFHYLEVHEDAALGQKTVIQKAPGAILKVYEDAAKGYKEVYQQTPEGVLKVVEQVGEPTVYEHVKW
ncbi:hypothetical protein SeMB42_g04355 [Synchytrium endobioticum]|uniref:Uncharacterized protein n=1 Tax=Synchytrium endobioticum TaxID=286115 RepID=A0A507CYR6_9FUNG|nr:hypothetical protein SeLEV6574_g05059 [Synchytrium endobioticum]TPX44357.1 hypothetical protein SeMB42_g04355 [Synchytrium endobioticum]